MSRFHDEFFRQGSPVHDALMIKCMSPGGIKKITDAVNLSQDILRAAGDAARYFDRSVTICDLKDGRKMARRGESVPEIKYEFARKPDGKTDWDRRIELCSRIRSCENASECAFCRDNKPWYKKEVKFSYHVEEFLTKIDYETEVLVKNGNFILGYADGVIKTTNKVALDAEIEADWVWEGFCSIQVDTDILIEAKPKITSIGEVIRQLKTYKSFLGRANAETGYRIPMVPVIITYSNLETDALDYLGNEGIKVVVFEEGTS